MSCILDAQDGSEQEPSLVALFTFVARDPISQRAMKINPLAPSTPLQKQRFTERQQVSDRRKEARKAGKVSSSEGALTLCPRACAPVQEVVLRWRLAAVKVVYFRSGQTRASMQ